MDFKKRRKILEILINHIKVNVIFWFFQKFYTFYFLTKSVHEPIITKQLNILIWYEFFYYNFIRFNFSESRIRNRILIFVSKVQCLHYPSKFSSLTIFIIVVIISNNIVNLFIEINFLKLNVYDRRIFQCYFFIMFFNTLLWLFLW